MAEAEKRPPARPAADGKQVVAGDSAAPFVVERRKWRELYRRGQYAQILGDFRQIIEHFAQTTYCGLAPERQALVDEFVEQFLFYFGRPNFPLDGNSADYLLCSHHILVNLLAMSCFQDSDALLRRLDLQASGAAKRMLLTSARSRLPAPREAFFELSAEAASHWYFNYFQSIASLANPIVWRNAREHLLHLDPRLQYSSHAVLYSYFLTTYIDCRQDRIYKSRLNGLIQEHLRGTKVVNRPEPGSLAIVSGKWFPGSAVYRCYGRGVRELAKKYRLTLVRCGATDQVACPECFAEVRTLSVGDQKFDASAVAETDFQAALFTDVGMTYESLYAANLRLAPVQILVYGHPSSSFSPVMDYFIGGAELEDPVEAEAAYSERLVLIPGLGQPAEPPRLFESENSAGPAVAGEERIVNCPWSQYKINFDLLSALREISARAVRPVRFRFFPNFALQRDNSFIPFKRDLAEAMGECSWEAATVLGREYIELAAQGDLALDSWPFNGYNTVVDELLLGKPILVLEGRRAHERVGAALLRRAGLPELIAADREEYIAKAVRLIDDDEYRQELSVRLRALDFRRLVFREQDAADFRKAVDFLLTNHDKLQADGSRRPVIVPVAEME